MSDQASARSGLSRRSFLQAAADPTRLAILRQLAAFDGPICACDFTDCCDLSQPTVSHHLRLLREADVQAPVVVGGIIPPADVRSLEAAGIARIYTPKNYELAAIMSDVAELAADYRRERTKALH